ncbi:MAG: Histidine kinase, dimerization and phosphoacceptor region [Marmoricola sp.]|nr:Histidine kinase, dimerization and phosphoacceptor region [Marmoricola sp.]
MTTERNVVPDAVVGGGVAVIGLIQALSYFRWDRVDFVQLLVTIGMAAAAALFRRSPGVALSLVWIACGIQVASGIGMMFAELAAAIVSFGTARFGSTVVLWVSGLSIPVGAVIAIAYLMPGNLADLAGFRSVASSSMYLMPRWVLFFVVALTGVTFLTLPWLLGLLLRSRETTRQSQFEQRVAETEAARAQAGQLQAQEIADLRAQQATLANDVHDVVGHSLAVILAQAESAQYLPADDPARIRQTMANIATSARQSLQDVRQVLATTPQAETTANGGLDSLIEGVRAAGNDVASTVVGTPQPLPPELDAVAFRVLQEMLTNALKHGVRGEPVSVERHWDGELRIEVRNVITAEAAPQADAGQQGLGLEGMRRRLESVGGRIDVRRRGGPDAASFTVTAWVPLRPAGRP